MHRITDFNERFRSWKEAEHHSQCIGNNSVILRSKTNIELTWNLMLLLVKSITCWTNVSCTRKLSNIQQYHDYLLCNCVHKHWLNTFANDIYLIHTNVFRWDARLLMITQKHRDSWSATDRFLLPDATHSVDYAVAKCHMPVFCLNGYTHRQTFSPSDSHTILHFP